MMVTLGYYIINSKKDQIPVKFPRWDGVESRKEKADRATTTYTERKAKRKGKDERISTRLPGRRGPSYPNMRNQPGSRRRREKEHKRFVPIPGSQQLLTATPEGRTTTQLGGAPLLPRLVSSHP
jgi:hypothetical protein